MDIYEAIYARRTVRDFKEKDIDTETIKKLIGAGLRAPSNNHMREWEFIIVNEKEPKTEMISKVSKSLTKKDAVKILDGWGCVDECQREMYIDAIPKQYKMLLNAACIIIPCFRQADLLKPKNLSALNPFASIWCCIQNILLAAAAEGIYGVTRIPFDKEITHLKKTLNIPEGYEIPCYMALGYPDDNAKKVEQLSVDAGERMHFNQW